MDVYIASVDLVFDPDDEVFCTLTLDPLGTTIDFHHGGGMGVPLSVLEKIEEIEDQVRACLPCCPREEAA
jgi:hypothetical protein